MLDVVRRAREAALGAHAGARAATGGDEGIVRSTRSAFCAFVSSAFPLARLAATGILSARCAVWSARSLDATRAHSQTRIRLVNEDASCYVPGAASPSQVNNSDAKFPLFAFHTVHTCVN